MSTRVMANCWPLIGMSITQKAVLISLADQANDDGVCWPSIATISERVCASDRAVQDAIKWLVSAGALQRDERFGRSSVYVVTPAGYAPRRICAPQHMHPTPANAAPPPPQMPHPTPANAAPRTVKNRNLNRQGTVIAPRSQNGTRLPDDWVPDVLFAVSEGFSEFDACTEGEKFKDYWRSQPGARGRKADWQATWRNWIRRAVEGRRKPLSTNHFGDQSFVELHTDRTWADGL